LSKKETYQPQVRQTYISNCKFSEHNLQILINRAKKFFEFANIKLNPNKSLQFANIKYYKNIIINNVDKKYVASQKFMKYLRVPLRAKRVSKMKFVEANYSPREDPLDQQISKLKSDLKHGIQTESLQFGHCKYILLEKLLHFIGTVELIAFRVLPTFSPQEPYQANFFPLIGQQGKFEAYLLNSGSSTQQQDDHLSKSLKNSVNWLSILQIKFSLSSVEKKERFFILIS
jgi:hypothetical protein